MLAKDVTETQLHKLLDASAVARQLRTDRKVGNLADDAALAWERLYDAIIEQLPVSEPAPY